MTSQKSPKASSVQPAPVQQIPPELIEKLKMFEQLSLEVGENAEKSQKAINDLKSNFRH